MQANAPFFQRSRLIEIMPLSIAVVLAFIALQRMAGTERNFEELALNEQTKVVFPMLDGMPVHCRDLRDVQLCIDAWRQRGQQPAFVWLGNSQLHSINQYSPGETTTSAHLARMFSQRGYDLLTFSQPNANLQEHYALFAYLHSRLPIRVLILPVCYDDLRETGLRDDLLGVLNDSETAKILETTVVGRRLLASSERAPASGDMAALHRTTQEVTESFLNDWLDKRSWLWHSRPTLRGDIYVDLYNARNTLFHITPSTKRRPIKGRAEENLAALEAILAFAKGQQISVLTYVPPLRSDVEIPYEEADYRAFKSNLQSLAEKYGARFANLEDLIPSEDWGKKDATSLGGTEEVDFMHFSARGHKVFANELTKLLQDYTTRSQE